MMGDEVPDQDQIVHYVKPSKILDDGTVDGSEFCLRPDDAGLSVNWLNYFSSSPSSEQLEAVSQGIQLQLSRNGRFAEFNVGEVREHLREECGSVRVLHDPRPPTDEFGADPSHCEIMGLPAGDSPEGELVGDMIAECIHSLHCLS